MESGKSMADVAIRLNVSCEHASKAIRAFIDACGETDSASPRIPTVEVEQSDDGRTVLHIDKRQVRVSTQAESEDKLEILLEPKGK